MTQDLFGTDGVRGAANSWPMDSETVLKVGMAAGGLFTRGQHRHRVVIGKDTRLSGYMVEQALSAGFLSVGLDVFFLGPLPTPAVAMLTRSLRADLGVMISASHNPFADNGIKLFGPDGYKLSDEQEGEIARRVQQGVPAALAKPEHLGRAKRIDDAQARYIEFAKRTFPKELRLEGLRVVVDCANGAAYKVAPEALWELGAEVIVIADQPNGFNINEKCGSTHPQGVCDKVREMRADIGIALDGDADRCIIVDEKGRIVDGDQVMALVATTWAQGGKAAGRWRRCYRHVQSRARALPRGPEAEAPSHESRRPLCRRTHALAWLQRRRRALRAHRHFRLRDHRRRTGRCPAGSGGGQGFRQAGEPGVQSLRTVAAVAPQRPLWRRRATRRSQGAGSHRRH